MKTTKKILVRLLREVADKIEKNECGLDDDELIAAGSLLFHRKMNIEQICQHFGVTRITINRWQQCGKLPPFRKDSGGKDYLYMDEMIESVEEWNKNHE